MKKYSEVLHEGIESLRQGKIADCETDAWILFEYCFGMNRTAYYLYMQEEADMTKTQKYKKLLAKRLKHVPVQYITGHQEFMGLDFKVNEDVLIPRQDTELLVLKVLEVLEKKTNARVLDMCTGSGCIAISICKLAGQTMVTAVDVSDGALKVAAENARLNQAEITLVKSDLFDEVEGTFDVIVSNPPYIETSVIYELEPEVREFEPMLALDGMEDGLYFYRRIIENAPSYLKNGGVIAFEIGYNQGETVPELLHQAGFESVAVYKDLCGRNRVVMGSWKSK